MRILPAVLCLRAFAVAPLQVPPAGERLFYAVYTEESWQSFRRNVGREDPEIWTALGTP